MRYTDLNSEVAFPLYGLPHKVQAIVREVADSRQAPIDYAAAPALMAIAVSTGKGAKIVADYENNANLFAGVVGDSAANKSTPATDMLAPLYAIHGEMVTQYETAMELYKMEEKASRTKGKKGQQEPPTPTPPPPPKQLMLTDVTPEARFEALRANTDGLLWHRDELKGLFDDFGRYSQSGEASDLLTIFDSGCITINRKGDGLKYLKDPLLSIFGTIQPRALHATFSKTIFLDSGLVPRFIWFYPVEMPHRDFANSRKPDHSLMIQWDAFIKSIYYHSFSKPITIEPSARCILDAFRNATGNGKTGYDATIWGKLHIYAYKLAGIAAIAHSAASGFDAPAVITDECMSWAVDCCYYFHRSAQAVESFCRHSREYTATDKKKAAIKAFFQCYPHVSQTDFAKIIGTSKQYVSKVLRNTMI